MKKLVLLLAFIYLQGCTFKVLEMAQGGAPINPQCPEKGVEEANPWWYAAVPLTIPLDIIGGLILLRAGFPLGAGLPPGGDASDRYSRRQELIDKQKCESKITVIRVPPVKSQK
ncbi:hypothetical protein [Methylomonas koyamae]|uniref:hypothetical protein n=1 Tax=Methylomonas koyamae TaxID=702114 RepID=UPI0006D24104|nr:hypothetical protein [Methylomonas koyamae]BBL58826.1 hypothetical protein MKFW12EY_24390 [Methylomonas koyamae]